MKAVIWTDVLQSAIMFLGMFSIFIKSVSDIGGFGNLITSVQRGKRDNFLK